MVREVINFAIGQCGNQIGCRFWEKVAQEHGLAPDGHYIGKDPVQLEKIDVYYSETKNDCFVPRALLIDMEKSVLNHITANTFGQMFRPENILSSTEGAANCFNNGFYSEDADKLFNQVEECMRKEYERTNCCQGFTFSHSASGGTGSGLSMRIFDSIPELLSRTFATSYFFTVFPSQQISNTVIEPYNTVLVLERLAEAENVVCFDNEALHNICSNTLQIKSPTFADMNHLICMVMTGTTASFRFSGPINTDMNKLSYALRAKPFLHFYIPSFAPLTSISNQPYENINVQSLVSQMTREENMMVETAPDTIDLEYKINEEEEIDGSCIAYAALFRGQMTTSEVDEALHFLQPSMEIEHNIRDTLGCPRRMNLMLNSIRKSQKYFPGNPRPSFNSITNFTQPGLEMSVTYLRNTTNIKFKFSRIIRHAMRLHSTNSFTHWYDEEKFPESEQEYRGLTECINMLASEWMPEFGVLDETNYPETLEADQIAERMLLETKSTDDAGIQDSE